MSQKQEGETTVPVVVEERFKRGVSDTTGHGMTITPKDCYAVEYSWGNVVAYIGPFDTELKADNCRRRWGRNKLNRLDKALWRLGEIPSPPGLGGG